MPWVTRYHRYDGQGNTRLLTDETGTVTDSFTYDAWGNEVARTGTSKTPFRWNGRVCYYWDEETGTYQVRRRPYTPKLARFISADPLAGALWTFAEYLYAYNDPLSYIDSSGMFADKPANKDCCCCVLFANIAGLIRYEDKVPDRFGNPLKRWGHEFTHISNMNYIKGKGGKCRIQFLECSTSPTEWTRDNGIAHDKWHDSYKLFKKEITNTTAENWVKYEKGLFPYNDVEKSGSYFEVSAYDSPATLRVSGKVLRIAIRVSSAEGCPCGLKQVTLRFLQVLLPSPEPILKEPERLETRKGERWEGNVFLDDFGDDETFKCGPVPFE